MKNNLHTPHDDVNAVLNTLLTSTKGVLKEQFLGMYLFGSLANGDFDQSSDIDVLVVTKDKISDALFSMLSSMHNQIATLNSPWATQQEVSYIPQNALRRFDPTNNTHPHLDRGDGEKLHLMVHANDWIIQRHILYEHGVIVEGPGPQTLIDPVTANDLKWAVVDVLPLWTDSLLKDPIHEIKPRGYQSYIVLSLCRMLYTIQYGAIISKIEAARWAIKTLSEKWSPLIERAIIGRQNPRLEIEAEDINKTLDLIHYTIAECKTFEKSNSLPTRYADVNEVLNILHSAVKEILKEQFIGMYLYGSLSSGDFNPNSSDIDFLVVTTDTLSATMITELESMHNRIWATKSKWASKLEGSYIPKDLIRRHDPNGLPCPTVNEGKFYVDQRGSDWIVQRHVIREFGVTLEGPEPTTLIDFVTPNDIRQAILGVLHEWWFPMLDNAAWLRETESGGRAFAVITMCRVLHALEHGTIVSKPKAIQWARTRIGSSWSWLIEKAVGVSQHNGQDIPVNEILDFIQFTMNYIKNKSPA